MDSVERYWIAVAAGIFLVVTGMTLYHGAQTDLAEVCRQLDAVEVDGRCIDRRAVVPVPPAVVD